MNFTPNALGISHKFMAEHIRPDSFCIDATAGRGRDTLFLAGLVGKEGKVLSFDIQEEAVASTKTLLLENGVENATVICDCHSNMASYAEVESVDGIMFNFGWLPGGDHNIFSDKDTSCKAVTAGLSLLKKGGVMSLCLYCGKENGYEEKRRILELVSSLDQKKYSVLLADYINRAGDPPVAVLITKEET